jgi:hypothetical protein
MKILSIGKVIAHASLDIISITEAKLPSFEIHHFDYIIINGGDGTIRRVIKALKHCPSLPPFILNPTGSFNVVAKLHRVAKIQKVLEKLAQGKDLRYKKQKVYTLNEEVFLFSAGNMGDLQHIFIAESLRFGFLKKGLAKYALAFIFLLPMHLVLTPFMLSSSKRFFVFTPFSFIKKFASFYGQVSSMKIELQNPYNLIELDGDIITIKEETLNIAFLRELSIIT